MNKDGECEDIIRITMFCKEKGEYHAFCNIDLLDENFALKRGQYVGVKDGKIAYIGDTEPQEDYGERYDGKHRLLMSGFYNVHSHAPMTLLRGCAENLPLQRNRVRRYFRLDKIDDRAALQDAAFHCGNAGERYGFDSRICSSSSA